MPKAEAGRTIGIGISTVKRYVGKAHKGEDLAPSRTPGKRRRLDEGAMRLLESDLKERPAPTLSQRRTFLERVDDLPSDQEAWMKPKKDRWVPQNERSS